MKKSVIEALLTHCRVTNIGIGLILAAGLSMFGSTYLRGESLSESFERLFSTCYTNGQFNGVCLVAEGERVIYRRAFGYAELEKSRNTEQTAFEIASVTKPMTASAILLLVKESKLRLDQEIADLIPNWPYPGITIRHLLTHTSGLPDYRPLFASDWELNRPVANTDLVARLIQRKPPVLFPAGAGWSYCNTGYAVLATVIERIAGQSFAQFMENRLFEPLNMKHSGVWPRRVADMAKGYLLTQKGYQPWSMDRHLDGVLGDGGVYATADDLHRFSQAIFSEKWLGELTQAMLTPIRTRDGGFHYRGVGAGLGWNLKFQGDETKPIQVFHTGNYGGFRTFLWHDLHRHWTVVLMDNLCHPLDEMAAATECILKGKTWQLPKKSIQDALLLAMQKEGISGALRTYQTIKTSQAQDYNLDERELNTLGYILLRENAVQEAIEIFRLNCEEHPSSFNAFDSLAEACQKKGDIAAAIRSYEQAVKLNPNYRPGIEAINKLRLQQGGGDGNSIGDPSAKLRLAATAGSTGMPTLREAFEDHFRVGTAVNRGIVTGTSFRRRPELVSKDIALVKDQFNQVVAENDMKWALIHPRPGADGYDFGPADAFVNFGLSNRMYLAGHTLVWHSQTPNWVFAGTNPPPPGVANVPATVAAETNAPGTNRFGRGRFGGGFFGRYTGPRASREELLERMRDHIHAVVGRYKGKIKVWDVVNEAIADQGTNILRNSLWLEIIGPDFIAKAFQYAHEADPEAILRYNDYSLENPAKRRKLIALIKSLQEQKVPVHAIGSQAHLNLSTSFEEMDQALTEMAALGLPIHITELDVNSAQGGQRSSGADIADNSATTQGGLVSDADRRLAETYAGLFRAFLKHKKSVKIVTFWGANDANSWRGNGKPLLFDVNGQPKPAFDAVIAEAKKVTASITPELLFPTPPQWKSSGVLVRPFSDPTHTLASLEDPAIIQSLAVPPK